MSAKGKERAAPIVLDDDDDSDTDFFTAPKRTYITPISVAHDFSPEPIAIFSDSDEASDGKKRRKRPSKSRAKPLNLPEWTKSSSSEGRNRKHSVGDWSAKRRDRSISRVDTIVLLSSDEEDTGKGKKPARRKGFRPDLTPPPEVSEERKREIRGIIDRALPLDRQIADDPDETSSPAVPVADPSREREDKVRISINMVADPALKVAGAAMAIKQYEKTRIFTCNRSDPISIMIKDLADRIDKPPEEIMLVYQGQPIVATRLSWRSVLVDPTAGLVGYEKHVWEALEERKRIDRARRLAHFDGEAFNTPPRPDTEESRSETPHASTPVNAGSVVLQLRGDWGQTKLSAKSGVTVKMLIEHYCRKQGREGMASQVKLMWDGEAQELRTTVEDMGAEHLDMMDMVVPKE